MKTRYKIALVVSASVMATLLSVLLIFNIAMNRQMTKRVNEAFESVTDYESEESPLYYADYIVVYDDEYQNFLNKGYYSNKQEKIIEYCKEHTITKIKKVEIDSRTYYLKVEEEQDYHFGTYSYIYYVDVTGEPEMISRINWIFLIAALITSLLGSIEGYVVGKKLEENRLSQKQFFENTSHELKTPLASIRGYAEGMQMGVVTDVKKASRVILSQTEQMSKLVDDILNIAKLESGALKIKKENVSIAQCIQNTLMPFEQMVLNNDLQVTLDLNEGNMQVDVDLFTHALSNLISNSIKYANEYIVISNTSKSISVWNDTNISDDELQHIFERFYTGKNGNTGIGLALCKDIVELHGYKISAKRVNNGICFEIEL